MNLYIKRTLYFFILLGGILYYSRLFRDDFKSNESVLFLLGFLPNLGLAFALPLIYIANRVNFKKEPKHFNLACIITFLVMILNEIVDKFQPKRVFDMLDIYATIVGIMCAFILYHFVLKNKLCQESSNQV